MKVNARSGQENNALRVWALLTLELWQRDGSIEETPLRAGSVVARPPGTGIAHSFVAGPEGVEMLIYGTREPNDMAWLPRSRTVQFGGLGVAGHLEPVDRHYGEPIEDD